MKKMRFVSALQLIFFALLFVSVCSAATRTVNVGQGGNNFVDQVSGTSTTTINAGDTVQWVWQAGFHSTTSGTCSGTCTADGQWDSGQQSTPFTFNFTFSTAGSFPYFCSVHLASMTGKVIVNPVVTNTNDSGPGSLRQTILDFNANPDLTAITFSIPGGGVQTITPLSAFPVMTHPGVLDGTSQPGWAPNNLVIELNGASAGASVNGLSIPAGNTTVRGLIINRFSQNGIVLQSIGNTIMGNFIGTNATGTSALANGGDGVLVSSGQSNNTIGGTTTAARNVISGNTLYGIEIAGLGTNANLVDGNFIGTDINGSAAVPNILGGMLIQDGPANNIVGGTSAGAGNLISGNTGPGVTLRGGLTTANLVQGNFIGTNAAGAAALGNNADGVLINNTASGNTVGGLTAGAGNLISGNAAGGVDIKDASTSNNLVEGNLIGTDAAGSVRIANGNSGVLIANSSSNNTIGGTSAGARNVISGNSVNISISGNGTTGNLVQGNYVGTNAAGTGVVTTVATIGVFIQSGATNNTVGGTSAAARNLISGTLNGVDIDGSGTTGNIVAGNYIGTDVTGTSSLSNGTGVLLANNAGNNTIGGTTVGARNVISGNLGGAVSISAASNNFVQGNFIGTDPTGNVRNANGGGVGLGGGASNNTIGGTSPGAGNVISGNSFVAIQLDGSGTSGNLVQGNFIGTNSAGNASMANGAGVYITNRASNNVIGGTTAAARNIISGNADGIVMVSGSNTVQGNFIGTDVTGTFAIGNIDAGVRLAGVSNNVIGGTAVGAGNVISGSFQYGIDIYSGSFANTIQGNLIGTNAAGTAAIANVSDGVRIGIGSDNTIGGTTAGAGNIISGNGGSGIDIIGIGTNGNIVQGNFIGTTALGAALANYINGVRIEAGASGNIIGGTAAGAGNIIAFNPKGVVVTSNTAVGNAIEGNTIYSNTGLGIDLNDDGVTPNTPGGPHTGPNNLQNYPVLTSVMFNNNNANISGTLNSAASTAFRLEFFSNAACDPSGHGQGRSFLGFQNVSTDGSGNASFSASFSTINPSISATATDPAGNTSEFSACGQTDAPLTNVAGRNLHVRLGKPFTLVVASFSDTDPSGTASQFTGTTIDWGDGNTTSGIVTVAPSGGQNYIVTGTHAYTKVGGWNVTVTIRDSGGATATATSKARLWPKPLAY